MRSTFILYSLWSVLLSSCGLMQTEDNVKGFIPGTYVTEWKNEFTEARDTLSIEEPQATGSGIYQIIKRSYYRQTIDGKLQKPHYKVQDWTGTYNPDVKTIMIDKTGRILSFNPRKNKLVEGTTAYSKIN